MITKGITVDNSAYKKITTEANFLVQNSAGPGAILVIASSNEPPVDADYGILIANGCGIASSLVDGTLWAKAVSNTPVVISVTE